MLQGQRELQQEQRELLQEQRELLQEQRQAAQPALEQELASLGNRLLFVFLAIGVTTWAQQHGLSPKIISTLEGLLGGWLVTLISEIWAVLDKVRHARVGVASAEEEIVT